MLLLKIGLTTSPNGLAVYYNRKLEIQVSQVSGNTLAELLGI